MTEKGYEREREHMTMRECEKERDHVTKGKEYGKEIENVTKREH